MKRRRIVGRSRDRQRGNLLPRAVRGTLLPLIRALFRRSADGPREPGELWSSSRHELTDDEAVRIALVATHEVREEMGRGLDREERRRAPSPGEVRKRREKRRDLEDEALS